MELISYCYSPRPEMGDGPWAAEPDHVQFEHAGLPCLAVRHPRMGFWCCYAGVPPGHPLHGLRHRNADYDTAPELSGAPAHYEIDYSAFCEEGGLICHRAAPGEPEPVWWFGMSFSHAFDLSPAVWDRSTRRTKRRCLKYRERDLDAAFRGCDSREVYRDLEFVKTCVRDLAEWLATQRTPSGTAQPEPITAALQPA